MCKYVASCDIFLVSPFGTSLLSVGDDILRKHLTCGFQDMSECVDTVTNNPYRYDNKGVFLILDGYIRPKIR